MIFSFTRLNFFALCAFLPTAILAAPEIGSVNGISVTTVDIQADALRIPADNRKSVLNKAETVLQLSNNLLIRRAFAAQAEAAGLANDPVVQAAMQIARDRVLSDQFFARMDAANKPADSVLEALARANYKSNPKRFDLPEETRARHILIRLDTPEAKVKATEILGELQKGGDFAVIAKEKSQDPGSAAQGGDLGFFPKGRMVPPFEEALTQLKKPGELSGVIESQFGYHVIKLEDRKNSGVRPFEDVKEVLIRETLAKVLNDVRLVEVQKIQEKIKFNQAVIEDFATSNK